MTAKRGPTMTIELREDGTISLNAPLQDKMLCYAMLEMARDLVKDHKPQSIIQPAVRVG